MTQYDSSNKWDDDGWLTRTLTEDYGDPVGGNWLCTTWQLSGKDGHGLFLTRIGELFHQDSWSLVLLDDDEISTLIEFFPTIKKVERFLKRMEQSTHPTSHGRISK